MIAYAILLIGFIYVMIKWFTYRKRQADAATPAQIESRLTAALNRTGEEHGQ